jgi:hypothetical protein
MPREEYTFRAEVVRGIVYVTRELSGIKAPFTKWDFLSEDERVRFEKTPFTNGNDGRCSVCGEVIKTEADFAKHFEISDIRYLNLGYCPKQLEK